MIISGDAIRGYGSRIDQAPPAWRRRHKSRNMAAWEPYNDDVDSTLTREQWIERRGERREIDHGVAVRTNVDGAHKRRRGWCCVWLFNLGKFLPKEFGIPNSFIFSNKFIPFL